MGDPAKEAQFCKMIFEGFVSQEKSCGDLPRALRREQSPSQAAGKLIALSVSSRKNLFLPRKLTGSIPTSPVQRLAALDWGNLFLLD